MTIGIKCHEADDRLEEDGSIYDCVVVIHSKEKDFVEGISAEIYDRLMRLGYSGSLHVERRLEFGARVSTSGHIGVYTVLHKDRRKS